MSQALYSILIPLREDALILPNSAVSEVTVQETLEPPDEGSPPWMMGWYALAERRVPVIAFEALNGAKPPALGRRTRLTIINSFGTRIHGSQFALLTPGHPQLISLTPEVVRAAALRPTDRAELLLSRLRVGDRQAAIPDLEAIEGALAASLPVV